MKCRAPAQCLLIAVGVALALGADVHLPSSVTLQCGGAVLKDDHTGIQISAGTKAYITVSAPRTDICGPKASGKFKEAIVVESDLLDDADRAESLKIAAGESATFVAWLMERHGGATKPWEKVNKIDLTTKEGLEIARALAKAEPYPAATIQSANDKHQCLVDCMDCRSMIPKHPAFGARACVVTEVADDAPRTWKFLDLGQALLFDGTSPATDNMKSGDCPLDVQRGQDPGPAPGPDPGPDPKPDPKPGPEGVCAEYGRKGTCGDHDDSCTMVECFASKDDDTPWGSLCIKRDGWTDRDLFSECSATGHKTLKYHATTHGESSTQYRDDSHSDDESHDDSNDNSILKIILVVLAHILGFGCILMLLVMCCCCCLLLIGGGGGGALCFGLSGGKKKPAPSKSAPIGPPSSTHYSKLEEGAPIQAGP